MTEARKARAVGVNHVALEVGDIDEALAFYGQFLAFLFQGCGKQWITGDWAISLQRDKRVALPKHTKIKV